MLSYTKLWSLVEYALQYDELLGMTTFGPDSILYIIYKNKMHIASEEVHLFFL